MRLGDSNDSDFIDRTGSSGGTPLLGGGGGLIGLFLPLILSRFGIVGILILALGYCALSGLGGGGLLTGGGAPTQQAGSAGQSRLTPEMARFLPAVLSSTDQVWTDLFRQSGSNYQQPRLVA